MNINITFNHEEIRVLLEAMNNLKIMVKQTLVEKNKEDILLKLKYAQLKMEQNQ